ncbi:DUF4163 domain-containing protein [Pseudomonas aeruginosa]|uniref:DUF4163 domain-containing protein n=1 Tax=Pseudomonas aeruginosa TaxID=287 RepID=UPI001115D49D|nr:DUF4163 domain-containing protein [Pseudomonas aeruginosa]
MERVVQTVDVFRTSRGLPENYVSRARVDGAFVSALTQDSHIVVHGSSKQGKTSLRKKNLMESDYVVIVCSNNWSLTDLHISILKEVGYQVSVSESKTIKGNSKVKLSVTIPFFSGVKGEGEAGAELAKQINKKNLELDPSDVNDVIRALKEIGFNKYIIIEDFHYMPEQAQVDFSVALKAFHELSSICFVIVGVWLEEDRLTSHNGDLAGRVISINADSWDGSDFDELFLVSESLLNIYFDDLFKKEVKSFCNGSVFLVQQLCLRACESEDVYQTLKDNRVIGKGFLVEKNIKELLSSQNPRYIKFLNDFSSGFEVTELELYKWILYAIIVAGKKNLELGLPAAAARRSIELVHPKSSAVSAKKLVQALRKSVDLQVNKAIKPIVFEYDPNSMRIKIVDRSFLLWKEYQDVKELLGYADLCDDIESHESAR